MELELIRGPDRAEKKFSLGKAKTSILHLLQL